MNMAIRRIQGRLRPRWARDSSVPEGHDERYGTYEDGDIGGHLHPLEFYLQVWLDTSYYVYNNYNIDRHCGLVVSAPAFGTGCEFDSWQCRIYIPCS